MNSLIVLEMLHFRLNFIIEIRGDGCPGGIQAFPLGVNVMVTTTGLFQDKINGH